MPVPTKVATFLEKMKPLPKHCELYITKVGFLTGSRAFRVAAHDTDWDYVMLEKEFHSMKLGVGDNICYEGGNYDFEGYRCWYAKCADGRVLNVLAMKSKWYWDQYYFATHKIVTNCRESKAYAENIKFKDFRVNEFHKFKDMFAAGVRE